MSKSELFQFEEEIIECFLQGEIRTPIHLVGGNEDQLIELFKDIKPNDWVFSTYRSHLHALLKGIPAEQLKRDILSGRSMHINSREHKFFTSSIVGGCLPIAVGVAMAIQRKGLDDKVLVFVGDMGAETGIFHECSKYAAGFDLPIKFVIEDNGLSVNSPTAVTWGNHEYCLLYPQKVKRYEYERVYPHQGTGIWVEFR